MKSSEMSWTAVVAPSLMLQTNLNLNSRNSSQIPLNRKRLSTLRCRPYQAQSRRKWALLWRVRHLTFPLTMTCHLQVSAKFLKDKKRESSSFKREVISLFSWSKKSIIKVLWAILSYINQTQNPPNNHTRGSQRLKTLSNRRLLE